MLKLMNSEYANLELKRIYGYNAHIIFLFGERGIGKTYWFKIKALKLAVKGIASVFMRRFVKETDNFRHEFMSDIPNELLAKIGVKEWKVKAHGILINGEPMIKIVALNDEKTIRGALPCIKPGFIYVDEINSLKGQFLTNEPGLLASAGESFFRNKKWKIFLASNFTLPSNPYFEKYNITKVKPLFLNKGKIQVIVLKTKSPSYSVKHGLNEEKVLNNNTLICNIKGLNLKEVFNLKYFNTLYKVVKFKSYYVIKRSYKLPKTKVFSLTGNDGLPQYHRAIGWYLPNFPIATILGLVRVSNKNDLFILSLLH